MLRDRCGSYLVPEVCVSGLELVKLLQKPWGDRVPLGPGSQQPRAGGPRGGLGWAGDLVILLPVGGRWHRF